MDLGLLDALTIALLAYLAVGLIFGMLFLGVFAARIDPAAKGASAGFRAIILPGAIALWPVLLRAVLSKREPRERSAHEEATR
jgi:hypothetical protein